MADSIAGTSDVGGEPWSPLTLHSVWAGVRRLDDIQAEPVKSRKVSAERLSHSVEHGVVDRETYDHRPRFDYVCRLEKGWNRWKVFKTLHLRSPISINNRMD
ncbi:winged helix-turn-helix transcriptional regulator [Nocardia fusca]|uniref:winged helix-turn-helix transcriptional regulator n=1 Tax=Nocardia fusca TaxID=941183 RepID=UPI0037CB7AC1